MLVQACNPSTSEAEAELQLWDQPRLCIETLSEQANKHTPCPTLEWRAGFSQLAFTVSSFTIGRVQCPRFQV